MSFGAFESTRSGGTNFTDGGRSGATSSLSAVAGTSATTTVAASAGGGARSGRSGAIPSGPPGLGMDFSLGLLPRAFRSGVSSKEGVMKEKKSKPVGRKPSVKTLERWDSEGAMRATDGCCPVDPDGHCEHGEPSWLFHLGFI